MIVVVVVVVVAVVVVVIVVVVVVVGCWHTNMLKAHPSQRNLCHNILCIHDSPGH